MRVWVRFVSWVDRHRASRVYLFAQAIERMTLDVYRDHMRLKREVAELQRRLDELDRARREGSVVDR